MKNWKTTVGGIILILTGIGTILTKGDMASGVTSIVAGISLIFAKDATNVSA